MKTGFVLALLCVSVFIGAALAPSFAARVPNQQVVAAHFPRAVMFAGAMLYGDYLIVHDDDNAEKGEPCLFIYRDAGEKPIVAVHCKRVQRSTVATFTTVTKELTTGIREIREIQFAGTAVGHQLY